MLKPTLFIDRDGTLIEEPWDKQVDDLSKIKLKEGVMAGLSSLTEAGFQLVMVSNQDGLGTDGFLQEDFTSCQDFILALFASQGLHFAKIFICPHQEEEGCFCRKPKTGLVEDFLSEVAMDTSWVIGDRDSDLLFAKHLNLKSCKISADLGWQAIASLILRDFNEVRVKRETKETQICLELSLDLGLGSEIKTPVPFFSHMLEQVAKHGRFSLNLEAKGDVEVDEHHLIEDTALVLGQGLKQALGSKAGIGRYGFFILPMDEALVQIALDLSSRPFCDFQADFKRERVGGLATEMIEHFFYSLAMSLGAAIHLKVTGNNHHHMIEACFKALGKALAQAMERKGQELPSTKGIL